MSCEYIRQLTYALLWPETALAAIQGLRGNPNQAAVEGLIELIYSPRTAKEAVAAVAALEPCKDPIILDALVVALDSHHASVRLAAVQDLRRRQATQISASLVRVLGGDESWLVRRAALQALASQPGPDRWRVLDAVTDPHWRVRHALIGVLGRWGEGEPQRQEIDDRMARFGTEPRVRGVRAYLHYLWTGRPPESALPLDAPNPSQACPFWDWDAAVLARDLERKGEEGRRQALDSMPFLLGHTDERIRAVAGKTLRDWGEISHLAQVVGLLDEPRHEAVGSVVKLLSELDMDRSEELARFLVHLPEPTPAQLAWALDRIGPVLAPEEEQPALIGLMQRASVQPPRVRCALARLAARWEHAAAGNWLRGLLEDHDPAVQWEALRGLNRSPRPWLDEAILFRLLGSEHPWVRAEAATAAVRQDRGRNLLEPLAIDPDARVRSRLAEGLAGREDAWAGDLIARLTVDPHPHVRAAVLTPAQAAELIKDPVRETSWHVLAKAARMARVPLWKLEPAHPWQSASTPQPLAEPLRVRPAAPGHVRLLGPERLAVAPMGISGHYGLPVEGFVRAYEAGVNLMFWEPNYQTLTKFFTQLPPSDRGAIHLLAGTFEADGERVQRDAERVLRTLKVERIAIFLLFWVQSWRRVTPDVREALERLKRDGKVAAYGLSTHSRPLAVEALETGWDPVMVRHSAAHRGAEEQIFPRAAEMGASLITFSNTCYGRLLEPHAGLSPPRAADCYRYTLMQPGVRACLSAPATLAQLDENLTALRDPPLPDERRTHLQAFGEGLYQEETTFRRFVRML
jgi:aryl-alcohol dehydrogenase-like predicted oxidoreductase/HEAT repeat protein